VNLEGDKGKAAVGRIYSGMKLAGSEGEVDNIGDCGNKYG